MWLLVGLGNPGPKHAGHRHNVGFQIVDEIAQHYHCSSWSQKFNADVSTGQIDGEKVLLCKPQTYMNCSGQAVGEALRYYKIEPDHVVVFYDELDLPLGKVRVKQGGGSGGHNGIKDIDQHIGKDYWRVRFGIDHPGHKDRVTSYVLSDFGKDEQIEVGILGGIVAKELPSFFKRGHEAWMSDIALAYQPPKTKTKQTANES